MLCHIYKHIFVEVIDCSHKTTGQYCQGCVDVNNDGRKCRTSSGKCGSCRQNTCLHSPKYNEKYDQLCPSNCINDVLCFIF